MLPQLLRATAGGGADHYRVMRCTKTRTKTKSKTKSKTKTKNTFRCNCVDFDASLVPTLFDSISLPAAGLIHTSTQIASTGWGGGEGYYGSRRQGVHGGGARHPKCGRPGGGGGQ